MRVSEFREAIKTRKPFVPVSIRFASRVELRLDHLDNIIIPPEGSAQRVAAMYERATDKTHLVDITFVESVVPASPDDQSDAA